MSKSIAITGSSGMIGSFLKNYFEDLGYSVYPISKEVLADSESLKKILLFSDVIINLAGENIGSGWWSFLKKKRIYESRINTTKQIVSALNEEAMPPKTFFSISAIGYYGYKCGKINGEDAPAGSDFLAIVCKDWEKAAGEYRKGRLIIPRLGIVLSKKGGFLKKMTYLANHYLLSKLGDGKKRASWIGVEDVASLILFLIEHSQMQGPINFTTPNDFTNEEFVSTLYKKLHKKAILPMPEWAVKVIFGKKGEILLLSDQMVHSSKLASSSYIFKYKTLKEYLNSNVL